MDAPNGQSYWLETLELAVVAMIVAMARGSAWTDPKTGAFSIGQLVQALGTAGTIAVLAAAGQSYWNFPWPITAGVSVFGALVGLPVILATASMIWDALVQRVMQWIGKKKDDNASGSHADKS